MIVLSSTCAANLKCDYYRYHKCIALSHLVACTLIISLTYLLTAWFVFVPKAVHNSEPPQTNSAPFPGRPIHRTTCIESFLSKSEVPIPIYLAERTTRGVPSPGPDEDLAEISRCKCCSWRVQISCKANYIAGVVCGAPDKRSVWQFIPWNE